jgi:uncharacterized NAD(P)/FAD-binding protein YdhS
LREPPEVRGRIAFAAIPWLMHDQPFVQGITACAEIGAAIAKAISQPASRRAGVYPRSIFRKENSRPLTGGYF